MKTICLVNQKGGVAKTTSAICIQESLKNKGYRTLVIDSDPQCNSSNFYQASIEGSNTLYDVLKKNCKASEAINHTQYSDIIPSDPLLAKLELEITSSFQGFAILGNALKEVEDDYDIAIIDCPPSLGTFLVSALYCSDLAIICCKAEQFSLEGLGSILGSINEVKTANTDLRTALLVTAYDQRNTMDKELWDLFNKNAMTDIIFSKPIHVSQDIKKSQALHLPLSSFKKSMAYWDYSVVSNELASFLNLEKAGK